MPCLRRMLGIGSGARLFARLFSGNPAALVAEGALIQRGISSPVEEWTLGELLAGVGPIPLEVGAGWFRVECDGVLQVGEQALLHVAVVVGATIQTRECVLSGGDGGGADNAEITLFMAE